MGQLMRRAREDTMRAMQSRGRDAMRACRVRYQSDDDIEHLRAAPVLALRLRLRLTRQRARRV